MFDLNDIAMFVQVVRCGSFAEAARRLAEVLKPWGIECNSMPLADAAKAKTLPSGSTTHTAVG